MNIEHLYEFIELSRQLNFTATAKTLNMTQPALSNHIHNLEQEAGVLLIERSAKEHARLTPAGQRFLEMSKKIVSAYDDTMSALKAFQQSIEGKITIRSPRHEYCYPLLNYVFEFQEEHPNIDIVIRPWNEIDGVEDIAAGNVDCAYIGYCNKDDELFGREHRVKLVPYAKTEILLWVDASHPLALIDDLSIEDINGYDLLIPANKKHTSWLGCMRYILDCYDLDCTVNEKYCDSLEDFVLTKATVEDILLCDASLLSFPPFQLRDNHLTRHFQPAVWGAVSLGYSLDCGNPALLMFVEFLQEKYRMNCETSK